MRLLLAEDEKELSDALVAILKHNNYSVDAVYDGEEALAYLEGQEYDGAILDIMMPKMDGISVLKKAREQGIKVPIMMLTAKSDIDDRVLGLDSGADDYLSKPFAMKELLARIRVMTRRNTQTSEARLEVGNLALDRNTFELMVGELSVRLANKEYQMMEMLMANPGQMISAERFMEKVWGLDTDTEMSVVWVNISNLRKKLVTLGAHVEIKAARNIGYAIEVKE